MTETAPAHLIDWQGNDWFPESGRPAAHPNARFTVPADQCPSIADDWEAHDGIPIDAIVFGGRRATNVPLVMEARDWAHGVFLGATVSSEQTAAAEGAVGELRRDPFAMLPFCGYNMADYWQHWLDVGAKLGPNAPKIFNVNWFRKSADGGYLWPGFGENIRVLEWIARRIDGTVAAQDAPIGLLPDLGDLDVDGLDLTDAELQALFDIDAAAWNQEAELTAEFFAKFGDKVPHELHEQLQLLRNRLSEA
jgi:phosphoenolpyruvate carboxykinase (GTP)